MKLSRLLAVSCVVLLSAASLVACKPGTGGEKVDPNLALIQAPAVGDIYAAELTEFTVADFTQGGRDAAKGYGLLKVVEVKPGKVVVITENAASEDPAVSKQDIKGDLTDITFDENERIDVVQSELEKAYTSGTIYAVRR